MLYYQNTNKPECLNTNCSLRRGLQTHLCRVRTKDLWSKLVLFSTQTCASDRKLSDPRSSVLTTRKPSLGRAGAGAGRIPVSFGGLQIEKRRGLVAHSAQAVLSRAVMADCESRIQNMGTSPTPIGHVPACSAYEHTGSDLR